MSDEHVLWLEEHNRDTMNDIVLSDLLGFWDKQEEAAEFLLTTSINQ